MKTEREKKIIARGLELPGTLLMVEKQTEKMDRGRVRVLVSSMDSALGVVEFFKGKGAETEIDIAGDDYHVIADLR